LRILIVDDSVTCNRLVDMLSNVEGVEHVHAAASPLEATRAIHSGWPDAVIFDINMPRGSGPRILEALRTGGPRILSIVLTHDSTLERREACLQAGADFFFDKSWEFRSVTDVIARLARGDAPTAALPPGWAGFDRLPVPSWLYDVDTLAFRAVNDAAVGLYGYSRDEFLTMTVADVLLSDGRAEGDRNVSERPSPTIQLAGRQQHRDRRGAALHVEVALSPLNQDGGGLGVALVHDISERVLAEQALGRVRGAVAHDFDHLLTIIMGRTQEMIDRVAADDPVRGEAVGIHEACGALARRIREIQNALQDDGPDKKVLPSTISPGLWNCS
jgi:PAS domain S-box-containing protein